MNNKPLLSIVIPTRNSSFHLETLLKSIKNQQLKMVEIIIVDNGSTDETLQIAKKYNVSIIICSGEAPQVAKQRNLGALHARGEYLYFMDHDMELSKNFIQSFFKTVSDKKWSNVDAWYVPEKIIAKSRVLSIARNFEAMFIDDTVISAARIIKKESFLHTKGYDKNLSGGPADWDFDIQLRQVGAKFAIFSKKIYHHEEKLTLFSYIFKKTNYIEGEEIYKAKWRKNKKIYENIVVKQYSLKYRIFWIFIENEKWKKLLKNIDRYFVYLIVKLSMVSYYVYVREKYEK